MTQHTKLFERLWYLMISNAKTDKAVIFIAVAGMVVGILALLGFLPTIVGSIALGLLAGQSLRPILQTSNIQTRTERIEKMVPYDSWPDECYGCGQTLGSVRGQFVVHKDDDPNSLKAVGLCETCTRTHSTLLDYSDVVAESFDHRDEPEEI